MNMNIEIEQECPICFNILQENNAYLLLTCCNKNVHIKCLDEWYNNNGKENMLCFLCTKECRDLESIIIKSSIIKNPLIEQNNITINANNNCNYKFFFCGFILLLICILIFILIKIKVF